MRNVAVLWFVAIVLACAAVAVPLFLKQIPLPVRLVAGFTNLLAAFAVAMVIHQKTGKR